MKSDTKFLIVGLGLIGGCYARRLTALGHRVCALDTDPDAIAYALEEGIIARGAAMDEALVREAGADSRKSLNMMLLAVAVAQGRVPLTVDELKDAVRACVKPQFVAMNLAAIDTAVANFG